MIVGCYDMHLYCVNEKVKHPYQYLPHQFTGQTERECLKQARLSGWKFKDGDALCPWCQNMEATRGDKP